MVHRRPSQEDGALTPHHKLITTHATQVVPLVVRDNVELVGLAGHCVVSAFASDEAVAVAEANKSHDGNGVHTSEQGGKYSREGQG
jgi:hypothetical protein